MNEQTLDQLKKRFDDLSSQMESLRVKLTAAKAEYAAKACAERLAEYAAIGINPGDKCVAIRKDWDGEKRIVCGFLGVEFGYSSAIPIISKLKNDGTPSKVRRYICHDRLELFSEAPE